MCHHAWPCFIFLRIVLFLLAFPARWLKATLDSRPKCSIHALIVAWSKKNKLVGGFNTEKYESQLGWLFPRYGKIEHVPKPPASKKFDRWKITRDGLVHWASRVASLAFSLRWMAAVLKRVPELALSKASGLVWLDQQNVISYHCIFGPLLIVDGFSWLSEGLLST